METVFYHNITGLYASRVDRRKAIEYQVNGKCPHSSMIKDF
jgi:hypothetical protein